MEDRAKQKKDRSIGPAVTIVLIFALITVIVLSIPLYRHRQYVKFTSELSDMTSKAGNKMGAVTCEMDGETFRLTPDAAYELYGKLIFMELKHHIRPDEELAKNGMQLTYGLLGGQLILAPAVYQGEEALYVEYHSQTMDYVYLAPHLRCEDFEAIVKNGSRE